MKTSKQLIAQLGINEAHAVALLNRRARYALTRDRTKFYASTPLGNVPVFGRRADGQYASVHDINADLLTLKLAKCEADDDAGRFEPMVSTAQYVAAWCRLNHLVGC